MKTFLISAIVSVALSCIVVAVYDLGQKREARRQQAAYAKANYEEAQKLARRQADELHWQQQADVLKRIGDRRRAQMQAERDEAEFLERQKEIWKDAFPELVR